jgi:hypothetical protein
MRRGPRRPYLKVQPTQSIVELTARIRAEFDESPGMRVTQAQISRLFLLDSTLCSTVVSALVDSGFLRKDGIGRYLKA